MLNSGVQEAKKENNMRKVLVIVTMMLTVCVTAFGQEDGLIGMMTSEQEYAGIGYDILIPNTPIALMPHVGLGFSWLFSAKTKLSGMTVDHFDAGDMGGDDYKWDKMPFGWYAGIKAKVQDKVILGFKYGRDFTELTKGVHMQTMTVSLGLCI